MAFLPKLPKSTPYTKTTKTMDNSNAFLEAFLILSFPEKGTHSIHMVLPYVRKIKKALCMVSFRYPVV